MSLPPVFDQAIARVFSTWTTLALAIEHSWGGRDSKQKGQLLQEEITQHLIASTKRRRIPSHENQDDVDGLADMLLKRVDELFNCELDDGSDSEVAYLCLRIFNTCREGDTSFADDFLKKFTQGADLSKCQGKDSIEYVTDEELLLSGMQGLDLEGIREGGEGNSDSESDDGNEGGSKGRGAQYAAAGAAAATTTTTTTTEPGATASAEAPPGEEEDEAKAAKAKARVVQEPIIDEDGFETVVKGRRRR
mmetsp:Transcript_29189/g.63346  ORF Transcript_29189/g.63346 Transcript_29189/m.63346 type:complete len:249 (+) Transcript_29189:97-843(+)